MRSAAELEVGQLPDHEPLSLRVRLVGDVLRAACRSSVVEPAIINVGIGMLRGGQPTDGSDTFVSHDERPYDGSPVDEVVLTLPASQALSDQPQPGTPVWVLGVAGWEEAATVVEVTADPSWVEPELARWPTPGRARLSDPDPEVVAPQPSPIRDVWVRADQTTLRAMGLHGAHESFHSMKLDERAEEVVLTGYVGTQPKYAERASSGEQSYMIAIGIQWCAEVRLSRPLGTRRVLDGARLDGFVDRS